MYDIDEYGGMISDAVRTDAYRDALRASIVPGRSVVLDLGCGTGIMAAIACRLGARRVYAVESEDVIEVARDIARVNGMTDRIEFIQALSTEIALPERVDVIVSDLHGALPPFEGHFQAIIDARRRFLAPGGALIPRSESLWFAAAQAPELHRPVVDPWQQDRYDVDLRSVAQIASNRRGRATVRPEQLLTAPVQWADLDYTTLAQLDCTGGGVARVERSGRAHGLCMWFDAVLADGIGFSNAPGATETIYGITFFRWPRAVDLREGDSVRVEVGARFVGKDYVWTWNTSIQDGGSGVPREDFRQSTFFSLPLSADGLRKRAAEFTPNLSEEGDIDRMILQAMAGKASLGDIARTVAERYPRRFPGWQDALARVADLSTRYSR